MKKIGSLFIMAALLLVVNSCQKEINYEHFKLSEPEARFLKFSPVKSGNDEKKKEFVQKIINDMDTQNKEKKFIENFVKKYGYPDWEMVRWFESSDETVAQVPVYFDEGCETEAVILCVEHQNKLHFRLFLRDDFEKFSKNKKPVPTAEKIKDLFIIFDFQKFGQSSYLPNGTVKNASEISAKLKSAAYYELIQTCYVIMVTSGSELLSLRQECEYDYEWVSVSGSSGGTVYVDWYDEINGGTGTTSTPYECDCNICTVCGGCLNEPQLKSIPIPGEGGSETDIACPMCSCTPTVSFFLEKIDKINLGSPTLLQDISCLMRDLALNGGIMITSETFEGVGDRYTDYSTIQKFFNYMGSIVEIVIINDPETEAVRMGTNVDTHLGEVIKYEIFVKGEIDPSGTLPNLVILKFKPEDIGLWESVWKHIKGESNLWNCN